MTIQPTSYPEDWLINPVLISAVAPVLRVGGSGAGKLLCFCLGMREIQYCVSLLT